MESALRGNLRGGRDGGATRGRRRRDLVRKSVIRNESIPPGFPSRLARCRSKIQSAGLGSVNRFAKRKSPAIIELVSHLVRARCSRVISARVERKRAKTARTKARSRFLFGRALARNYGGWRALLHRLSMCRRVIAKTIVVESINLSRWIQFKTPVRCGDASITNGAFLSPSLPLSLLPAPSIAVMPEG